MPTLLRATADGGLSGDEALSFVGGQPHGSERKSWCHRIDRLSFVLLRRAIKDERSQIGFLTTPQPSDFGIERGYTGGRGPVVYRGFVVDAAKFTRHGLSAV
jgi:hypothetical protein